MLLRRRRPTLCQLFFVVPYLYAAIGLAAGQDASEDEPTSWGDKCYRPHVNEDALQEHACSLYYKVCIDQGRFITFSDDSRPGRTFWKDDVFEATQPSAADDGPFYNLPGYLDNYKGTKKSYRKPLFRGNSSRDFPDILHPQFDDCSVPLVWWPWWPYNPGDFFLSSLAPFHAMLGEDVIDRNIRYTPGMDGLTSPGYFQWYFDPITHHKVESLEDMSDRSRAGSRCFERILMCRPYSIWFQSPGREWHAKLKYGTLGQEIVQFHQSVGRLTDIYKSESLFRIAFIERKHKRRIVNFEELLSSCNTWQLPEGTRYDRVECWSINLDDADRYMENLSQLRAVDVLVGMHGAGLINHNFMKPHTSFIEILPCMFGGWFTHNSFKMPSQKENIIFAWQIQAYNPVNCHPSRLESHNRRQDLSDADWILGSLKRDQDLTVDLYQLGLVLGRIAAMGGDRDAYQEKMLVDPDYFNGVQ